MKMVNFNIYEDLTKCAESMLFDSGTEIAEATFELDDGKHMCISLEVRGEVRVTYKGELYRCASEFPTELKELITNEIWWDCDEDVYVGNNNWFEYIINIDGWVDGVVCEGDLTNYTEEKLINEMKDLVKYYSEMEQ